MDHRPDATRRAAVHAALADPLRVEIVDALRATDRTPGRLADELGCSPSRLTFHLDALERAGIIRRARSEGDRRRWYLRLRPAALAGVVHIGATAPPDPVFVCTRNSARSQLAAALWRARIGDASSAGTDPAAAVHHGAVAAARRAGLDLAGARPGRYEPDARPVITVCDRAHEELRSPVAWHWSVPDPVTDADPTAFDTAFRLIRDRIDALAPEEHS